MELQWYSGSLRSPSYQPPSDLEGKSSCLSLAANFVFCTLVPNMFSHCRMPSSPGKHYASTCYLCVRKPTAVLYPYFRQYTNRYGNRILLSTVPCFSFVFSESPDGKPFQANEHAVCKVLLLIVGLALPSSFCYFCRVRRMPVPRCIFSRGCPSVPYTRRPFSSLPNMSIVVAVVVGAVVVVVVVVVGSVPLQSRC